MEKLGLGMVDARGMPSEKQGVDRCGFCSYGRDAEGSCGTLHCQALAEGGACNAHKKCMQYSSDLSQHKFKHFGGFEIAAVQKEMKRGYRLKCHVCKGNRSQKIQVRGATVGCSYAPCSKTFHYPCANSDRKTITKRLKVMGRKGGKAEIWYRVYCSEGHYEKDQKKFPALCTGWESDTSSDSEEELNEHDETDSEEDPDFMEYPTENHTVGQKQEEPHTHDTGETSPAARRRKSSPKKPGKGRHELEEVHDRDDDTPPQKRRKVHEKPSSKSRKPMEINLAGISGIGKHGCLSDESGASEREEAGSDSGHPTGTCRQQLEFSEGDAWDGSVPVPVISDVRSLADIGCETTISMPAEGRKTRRKIGSVKKLRSPAKEQALVVELDSPEIAPPNDEQGSDTRKQKERGKARQKRGRVQESGHPEDEPTKSNELQGPEMDGQNCDEDLDTRKACESSKMSHTPGKGKARRRRSGSTPESRNPEEDSNNTSGLHEQEADDEASDTRNETTERGETRQKRGRVPKLRNLEDEPTKIHEPHGPEVEDQISDEDSETRKDKGTDMTEGKTSPKEDSKSKPVHNTEDPNNNQEKIPNGNTPSSCTDGDAISNGITMDNLGSSSAGVQTTDAEAGSSKVQVCRDCGARDLIEATKVLSTICKERCEELKHSKGEEQRRELMKSIKEMTSSIGEMRKEAEALVDLHARIT